MIHYRFRKIPQDKLNDILLGIGLKQSLAIPNDFPIKGMQDVFQYYENNLNKSYSWDIPFNHNGVKVFLSKGDWLPTIVIPIAENENSISPSCKSLALIKEIHAFLVQNKIPYEIEL